jgi:hypothetical protein
VRHGALGRDDKWEKAYASFTTVFR